jgi:ABC-2 type transport system ATP-binding protein
VRAVDLTRTFDARVAVDGLSLDVARGEIVALLGPNGAGKTTTFRMLAGLIAPTRGEVIIDGTTLGRGVAARVGLLTEVPGLWERLSVRMNLLTYARLHGVDRPHAAVERVAAATGVDDRIDERAGALSKGLKQRVALARALIHDPAVILLDEPTAGLDPSAARQVRDLIASLGREGRAVLVSTHNLAEAEELSDRIAVLKTRLVAFDTPSRLRSRLSGVQVTIEVEGPAAGWAEAARRAGAAGAEAAGNTITVALDNGLGGIPDLVASLVAAGARIVRVEPQRRSLEEVYLALVGHGEGAA